MPLISIIILIAIVVALMVYNISIHNKIKAFSNINQKINSLNVLQEFMNIIGEEIDVDAKIKKINEILIEKFEIKYSTIVSFNGAEYVIKATNVDEKHFDTLKNLHTEDLFKESIANATSKYVTIDSDEESLPYQKMEFGRAKSAMFFPLYVDSVYIGYWFIESGEKHAFDQMDTTILEIVRENIMAVLKTVTYQDTIENISRKDLFSGLQSEEYLYGAGKKIIDKYIQSTVCMFKIINLPQINEEFSRETGNEVIKETSQVIKSSLSNEYVFVRYMGPKFVIVFSGVEEADSVLGFIKDIKKYIENMEIPYEVSDSKKATKKKKAKAAKAKLNFAISTYYKGVSLDVLTRTLEQYLDEADPAESNINYV